VCCVFSRLLSNLNIEHGIPSARSGILVVLRSFTNARVWLNGFVLTPHHLLTDHFNFKFYSPRKKTLSRFWKHNTHELQQTRAPKRIQTFCACSLTGSREQSIIVGTKQSLSFLVISTSSRATQRAARHHESRPMPHTKGTSGRFPISVATIAKAWFVARRRTESNNNDVDSA